MDFRVRHALRLISEDLSRPLVLEEIARAVNLSVPRLPYLFKAETGMTPAQYLKSLSMQKAKEPAGRNLLECEANHVTGRRQRPESFRARLPRAVRTHGGRISKEGVRMKRRLSLAAVLLCLPFVALMQRLSYSGTSEARL
jgi:hypothetical protein